MNAAVPSVATPAGNELGALLRAVAALTPETPIAVAAERMLESRHGGLLCLPIVDAGRCVGVISRLHLNQVFLQRFGRELWGARPVSLLMNPQPVQIDIATPLAQAAERVTAGVGTPLSEDFVLVSGERYLGMGIVLDLLSVMQNRLSAYAGRLAQAVKQLHASQGALVQSEKMASLGVMVAGLAHEINTPLGYVRNNLELLQELLSPLTSVLAATSELLTDLGAAEPDAVAIAAQRLDLQAQLQALTDSGLVDEAPALLDDAVHGVDTIRDLVVNLRNFSRVDAEQLTGVDVHECLEQTLRIAGNLLRDRVEVLRQYGAVPAVQAAPAQINQVLLNLVTNAVQAIEHTQGRLLLKTYVDGEWVCIQVQDNGKGIAAEQLSRIFDPFFTTKPVGQGTGLGLSICHQIVQAHGGRIQVASAPGRGTRFTLRLPHAVPAPAV